MAAIVKAPFNAPYSDNFFITLENKAALLNKAGREIGEAPEIFNWLERFLK